jgi:hypothetical protein
VDPQAADLIRRFEFERWRRPAADEVKYFLWRLVVGPQLLADWQPVRVREEPLPADCRYTTSIWSPRAGAGLLRLDVYEEPSRQAAELRLLDLLDNFQSPRVRRDEVAAYPLFRYGDDAMLALARGNLAVFAANAERVVVSLKPVLADIDRLFRGDQLVPAAVAPDVRLAAPAAVRVRVGVPLAPEVDYPLPVWYRIATRLGEVHRAGTRLVYEADAEGEETLQITAIGADGRATHLDRTFTVGRSP